jgi:membrane protein implicated in regulation of membrane protease activity|tara:strand:+ start:25667 stop:26230 length:564 start_codon:yes stop_codon:yes gene_type:complete
MENSQKANKNLIRVALATLIIGFLMQILHWPYSAGIIFTSFAMILLLYAYRFSKKKEKKPIDIIKMALVLFWTTNGLLTILNFPYTLIFQLGTGFTFIAWFAMEGTAYFMDKKGKVKNSLSEIIWNFIMVIGVLTIILGGLMHLLNWNYAIPTLTLGLTIITSFILKDIFTTPKKNEDEANNEELYS